MGYIYKITNNINQKVYIGKTCKSIQERFNEHLRDCQVKEKENRPLYLAIKKYGQEHFTIEEIEKCLDQDLEEREKYWIVYYNSYHNGYNATLGGDGKLLYNHEAILKRLQQGEKPKSISSEIGCSMLTVYLIARHNNIDISGDLTKQMLTSKKRTYQFTKDNQYIQSFESVNDAARWVVENNLSTSKLNGISGKICNCANQKTKSAYGYIWKYYK